MVDKRHTPTPELKEQIDKAEFIAMSFMKGMFAITTSVAQQSGAREYHLLSYLFHDLLQSSMSLASLTRNGMPNVARREIRFIIEAAIKISYIQQKDYDLPIQDKLVKFDKEISSQKISIKNDIDLYLLPTELHAEFLEAVGRLYGAASHYVHLSPTQMVRSIQAVQQGHTSGHERPSDVAELNDFMSRALAAALVLLFHAAPSYVAGDLLVESDGSSLKWYFAGSKFIAAIDSKFDYKAERKENLPAIQTARCAAVSF